jgi:hypothetical protein
VGSTVVTFGAGTACKVFARKAEDSNYKRSESNEVIIEITKLNQAELVIGNSTDLKYGPMQLFTIGGSGTGAVRYEVDNAVIEGRDQTASAVCELVQPTANGPTSWTLRPTSQGHCRVSAIKDSSTNYNEARSESVKFEFRLLPQTVTFTSMVPTSPVKGGLFRPVAVASGDGAVSYSIVSGSSCAFSPTEPSNVVFGDPGLCEIRASVPANDTMAAAFAILRIEIGKENQNITFDSIPDRRFSQPMFWLTAKTSARGLTVSYSSADTRVCQVSGSGTVTPVSAGICSITASQPGNEQYFAATPVTRIFKIIADTPGAPHIVSLSSSNQSITASFRHPSFTGGTEILRYRLEVTRDGSTSPFINSSCMPVNGTNTCTITGIPNTSLTDLFDGKPREYTVQVAAVNSAGVGAYAQALNKVSPTATSQAVSNLTGIASTGQLLVEWEAPLAVEGRFMRYEIYVWPSNVTPSFTTGLVEPVVTDEEATSAVISLPELDLINNMGAADGYKFAVVTISSAFQVPIEITNVTRGEKIGYTTPGMPGVIELTPLEDQLNLGWPAPLTDGGQPILGYEVMVNDEVICSVSTDSGSPSCENTSDQIFEWAGLDAGKTYTFQVGAVNALGVGPMRSIDYTVRAPIVQGGSTVTPIDLLPGIPGGTSKPGSTSPDLLDQGSWSASGSDTDSSGQDPETTAPTKPSEGSDTEASGSDSEQASLNWLMLMIALLMSFGLLRVVIRGRK